MPATTRQEREREFHDGLRTLLVSAKRSGPPGVAWPYYALSPILATVLVGVFGPGATVALDSALLAMICFAAGGVVTRSYLRGAQHLPFAGGLSFFVGPVVGGIFFAVVSILTGDHVLSPVELVAVVVISALVPRLLTSAIVRVRPPLAPVCIAVAGPRRVAKELMRELELTRNGAYDVAGVIDPEPFSALESDHEDHGAVPLLGSTAGLADVLAEHRIDLLILTQQAPRVPIVEQVGESQLPTAVCDLPDFCERVFGHVPISEINATWLQYNLHPTFRVTEPPAKRILDLVVGVAAVLVLAPLLALLALLVRAGGGPALFRQERIGEGGRPFHLYKLRTMHVGSPARSSWSSQGDPRVTRVGRFLRRSHLDELPQLINVIRGEMSLVGPRPEQPEFVRSLEAVIPFYSRRHQIKPGLTGWAQVRNGYSGSEVGSARKLCYDLYYLKHRSLALDVAILAETLRTLVFDSQYPDAT